MARRGGMRGEKYDFAPVGVKPDRTLAGARITPDYIISAHCLVQGTLHLAALLHLADLKKI
jgi:hypothetical protein